MLLSTRQNNNISSSTQYNLKRIQYKNDVQQTISL